MERNRLEPRGTKGPAGLTFGRYLSVMVAAVLIALAIPSGGSAAPLRQARVEGYHEGPWVQTTCTFTDCNTLSKRSSLRWGLSPTHRGVALHSYSGKYHVSMRWLPSKGIYRGELDVGKYWRKRWDLHVVEQRQIDGTWTGTKLAGTTRLWTKRAPRYHQTGKFTLHRKFGFGRLVF